MNSMNVSVLTRPNVDLLYQRPRGLCMPVDEIHIWQVSLTDSGLLIGELWNVLDSAERQKAIRFRKKQDQTCSILSRGMLRAILAWYLDIDPVSLEFYYGVHGRPYLPAEYGLDFSVSHSDDLILYSFARGCRVGIDVEHETNLPEWTHMINRLFSSREQDWVASLSAPEQRKTFFKLWTLKEAYGKMQGDGLTDSWKDIDILSILKEQNDLSSKTFIPTPEYAAALVAEGHPDRIVCFNGFQGITS
jgi:4'-phosphopantetheinyl transferase